jgi:hypothetical protein
MGPGIAWDGKPKFDLNKFDEEYFSRMRKRVEVAREKGIYVSIKLSTCGSYSSPTGQVIRSTWVTTLI